MEENLRPVYDKANAEPQVSLLDPRTLQLPRSQSLARRVSDSNHMPPPLPRGASHALLGSPSSESSTAFTKRPRPRSLSPADEGRAPEMASPSSKRARTSISFDSEFTMSDLYMEPDMVTEHDMNSQISPGGSSDGGWFMRCPPPTPDDTLSPGDMGSTVRARRPSDVFQSSARSGGSRGASASFEIYEDTQSDEQLVQAQLEKVGPSSQTGVTSTSENKENVGVEVNPRDTSSRSSRNLPAALNPVNVENAIPQGSDVELMDTANDGDDEREVSPSEADTIITNVSAPLYHHSDRHHRRASSMSTISSSDHDMARIWDSDEEFRSEMDELLRDYGETSVADLNEQLQGMIDQLPSQSATPLNGRQRFLLNLQNLLRIVPLDVGDLNLGELIQHARAEQERERQAITNQGSNQSSWSRTSEAELDNDWEMGD